MTHERNKYGLYDTPVRFSEKEQIILSRAEVDAHCAAGFMMTHEQAAKEGFLYPHDEQDTVIGCVQEGV